MITRARTTGSNNPNTVMMASGIDVELLKEIVTTAVRSELRTELKPLKDEISSLNEKFIDIQNSLQNFTVSAEHANSVATSAMAVASNVDKQMSSLKQMIENNQVKYNKLQEHTLPS